MPSLQGGHLVLDRGQQRVSSESDLQPRFLESDRLLLRRRIQRYELWSLHFVRQQHILQGERLRETHI